MRINILCIYTYIYTHTRIPDVCLYEHVSECTGVCVCVGELTSITVKRETNGLTRGRLLCTTTIGNVNRGLGGIRLPAMLTFSFLALPLALAPSLRRRVRGKSAWLRLRDHEELCVCVIVCADATNRRSLGQLAPARSSARSVPGKEKDPPRWTMAKKSIMEFAKTHC